MREQLFTLIPLDPELGAVAPSLTLAEAFTRLMAAAGATTCFSERVGSCTLSVLGNLTGSPSLKARSLSILKLARPSCARFAITGCGSFAWSRTSNSARRWLRMSVPPMRSEAIAVRLAESHALTLRCAGHLGRYAAPDQQWATNRPNPQADD
jgi:hypothetical protein